MILLILYYVYKWITVPWSYYESARTRRRLHQNTMASKNDHRRQLLSYELKRHELIGLIWVILSPVIAGYTLQYSRYFLNNYDKYMSVFNITVFVVAASLKPVSHIMTLLRERTLFLQSEVEVQDTVVETLQKRIDVLEDELDNLRQAFATKKDLGQATQSLNPTIQQLSKAMRRMEKKEANLRSWSETQFAAMEQKVHEYDQYICYRIEQDQRRSTQHTLITLVFLPLNLTLWFLRRMSYLLPIPRALLGLSIAKPGHSLRSPVVSKHLLHSEEPTAATTMHHLQDPDDLAELNYSGGEESAGFSPAFGHHHRPFTPKRP
ncbi:uncharacterized protein BYT42DRAFT_489254 [Radiomyces spectabilis]|uniref:uncharacterized protein n=1 Tax=Radiomyces spectabilis TaxID=64574 RepID=UPI00221ED98D|nr:uncharacterized protein BYT42DRAFT_489254 [Radiomyces spectabilis]KAI8391507.1 hypothetical protein BYT42DRAFT_489254 [Radiomyces spectabilis]